MEIKKKKNPQKNPSLNLQAFCTAKETIKKRNRQS